MGQNQDYGQRDKIIFGKTVEWQSLENDTFYFETLSIAQLKELLDKSFLNPMTAHNMSPTIAEFSHFMESYPEVRAHGYVESPKCENPKIVIEGLTCMKGITENLKADFERQFKNADEFISNQEELYCWYD